MTKAHKSVLDGVVETVVPGSSLTVSNTDPKNPVVNARIADQATAEAGIDNEQLMTALSVAQSIAKNSPPTDISLLTLALSEISATPVSLGKSFADGFKSLGSVNVSGATKLNTTESSILKPTPAVLRSHA